MAAGYHTVTVISEDSIGNSRQNSVYFTVERPELNDTDEPYAVISNLKGELRDYGKLGTQEEPNEVTTGLYPIEGIACHPAENQQVQFQFELYDPAAMAYGEPNNREPLDGKNPHYPDYLIQRLTVYDASPAQDTEGYYTGPVGAVGALATPAVFGNLDLTGVNNGTYALLLTVRSRPNDQTAYKYSYAVKQFVLNCPLKIGNVKFSQEDTVVTVGGVPLSVVRTYDSFQKDKSGDFGYGWSYSIANMDIQLDEDRVDMAVFDADWGTTTHETESIRVSSNYDRNVTLTLPDGNRATFQFYLEYQQPRPWKGEIAPSYIARYQSPEGVTARLETYKEEILSTSNVWDGQSTTSDLNGGNDPDYYEFSGYKLITDDGTIYTFNRESLGKNFFGDDATWIEPKGQPYLASITTSTGETINMNVDENTLRIGQDDGKGVECYMAGSSAANKAITIEYGTGANAERIVAIYAPSEQGGTIPTVWYDYDTAGNLSKVHKLVNKAAMDPNNGPVDPNLGYETLTYEYDNTQFDPSDHYITAIKDPRGLQPIQYLYDEAGRLVGTKDAKGNTISLAHNITGRIETVTDRAGNPTFYEYDDKGNVKSVTDCQGHSTTYTYDSDNPLKISNVKTTTTQVPDYDNPLDTLDAITTYDYVYYDTEDQPGYGKIASQTVTDPVYNRTEANYDTSGNVTSTTTLKARRDTNGQIVYQSGTTTPIFDEVLTTQTKYITKIENGITVNTGLPYLTGTTTGSGATLQWLSLSLTFYTEQNQVLRSVSVDMNNASALALIFNEDASLKSYTQLAAVTSWTGCSVTSYDYDSSLSGSPDQPYSITGPDNQTQYFSYDQNNQQVESWTNWIDPQNANHMVQILSQNISDAAGRVTQPQQLKIEYTRTNPQEQWSEISRVTLPLSMTEYNSIGKVDYTISEPNILTKYDYDQTGNTVCVTTYNIGSIVWTDKAAILSYINNPNTIILTESRTLYDDEGRAVVSVGPYDPAVAVKDRVGTETVYNNLGQVERTRKWADVAITLQDVIGTGGAVVGKTATGWTSGHDVNGNALAPIANHELSYNKTEYDTAGRAFKSYSLNELRSEICGSEYRYDIAGRQTKTITLPDVSTKRSETTTVYDGSRRQSVTDGLGKTTSFEYDELGRVVTTVHPATIIGDGTTAQITYTHVGYDGMGRKSWEAVQTIHANTDEDPVLDSEVKSYDYDITGRLISVTMPAVDDPENSYAATNPLYNYYYDSNGDQVCILDDKGRATVFEYDYMHRLVKKYQPYQTNFTPSATQTRPAYSDTDTDLTNDILSQKPTGQLYEQSWYDDFGRLWKAKSYASKYTVYTYNALGQLEYERYYLLYSSQYPLRLVKPEIYYTYDNLGRKLTVRMREYNVSSQVVAGTEQQWEYQYDNEGNLVKIISPQGTINYDYSDITGHKISTYTGADLANAQTKVDYGYDELGRLDSVDAVKRNSIGVNELTQYSYDLNGNRKSTMLPNGVYTWYDYNALNRLTTLKHFSQYEATPTNDTYRISSFAYKLNAQGMRTGITEFVSQNRYLAYQYDALNRLEQEDSYNASAMNPSLNDGYTAKYEYDIAGNRLGRQVKVVRNSSNPETNILSTDYTEYDSGDRLRKEHSIDQAIFAAIPQGENDRIYACADGQGGFGYKLPDSTTLIGQFKAFLMGLPSVWNRWLLITLMVCIPLAFLWPTLTRWIYKVCRIPAPIERPTLSLYHRSLCILFAYVFLIGPEVIQSLAYADTQYDQLSTQAWGHAGDYITYYYDANGSQTYKIYSNQDISGDPATIIANNSSLKYDKSEYSLQNHLSKLTQYSKPAADAIRLITEYAYNPEGIRVGSKSYKTVNNGTAQDKTTTDYLVDSANHTGYAQVLEERTTSYNASDVPTTQNCVAYTIGDDIISQTKSSWTWNTSSSAWDLTTQYDTEYLLYDGQGSTRQLVRPDKTVIENYNYDSYGVMLGGNPTPTAPAATKMLYTGEQFDSTAQNYYLRARYYDPMNGRFTQMDPYAGNTKDPQSLHKYLYAHCNPANNVDPSGLFSLGEMLLVSVCIGAICMSIANIVTTAQGKTREQITEIQWKWFWRGFLIGAIVYSAVWAVHSIWLWLYGGGVALSNPEVQTRLHHFASNKHSFWTPRFEEIISKYGLKLNDAWNLNPFSTQYHNSSHPPEYHKWVFEQMTLAANEAGQSANQFILLFQEYVVIPVMKNPEMLKAAFWRQGG